VNKIFCNVAKGSIFLLKVIKKLICVSSLIAALNLKICVNFFE
jgi:hypothetical protein